MNHCFFLGSWLSILFHIPMSSLMSLWPTHSYRSQQLATVPHPSSSFLPSFQLQFSILWAAFSSTTRSHLLSQHLSVFVPCQIGVYLYDWSTCLNGSLTEVPPEVTGDVISSVISRLGGQMWQIPVKTPSGRWEDFCEHAKNACYRSPSPPPQLCLLLMLVALHCWSLVEIKLLLVPLEIKLLLVPLDTTQSTTRAMSNNSWETLQNIIHFNRLMRFT